LKRSRIALLQFRPLSNLSSLRPVITFENGAIIGLTFQMFRSSELDKNR